MKLVRKAAVQDAKAIARAHVLAWQHAYCGVVPDDLLDSLSVPKRAEMWSQCEEYQPSRHLSIFEDENEDDDEDDKTGTSEHSCLT